MSARVLQSSDLFALEKQQWSDYRNNYAFNDQPFNFSAADLLPANQTPLLNANEADFLNQLFDHPPNAFDDTAFIDADLQKNLGLEYNWLLNEPPPTLQEVSGSAPAAAHPFRPASISTQSAYAASASNQIPASPAEDVLGAASALLGTQPTPHQHQRSPNLSISTQNLGHAVPSALSSAYLPTTTPTKTASPTPTLRQRRSPGADSPQLVFNLKPWDEETDTILTPGLGATFDQTAHAGLAPPRRSMPTHARTYSESHLSSYYPQASHFSGNDETNRRLYRFGSDSHFCVNGYVRAPEEPSEEQLTRRMLDENFGAISAGFLSADSTRAPSPSSHPHGLRRMKREADEESDDASSSPHKRRRANDDDAPRRQTWRRRASTSLVSPLHHRRRKSSPPTAAAGGSSGSVTPGASAAAAAAAAAAAKKAPRENLSEEQKRNNHIVSEQKRRNLIKFGFEELNVLVPGLREGGFSKSNVLQEASAYLDAIVAGNRVLRARLGDVGGDL